MIQFLIAQIPLLSDLDPVDGVPSVPAADLGGAVVKMLLVTVTLVALLWLTYWTLRRLVRYRLEKGGRHDSIVVLEKKMISAKTMLYLVRVENKTILLAESHLELKRLESFDCSKEILDSTD